MPKTPEDVVVPLVERPLEAELGQLANEFDLTQPQAATLAKCVQCEGIQYVREQAEIVRSKPNVRNLAGALLNALEKGWRKPKTAPKSLRRKAAEPEGWREWIKEKYPNADIPGSWKELFPSVQNEFLARKSVAAGIPAKSESA